MWGGKLCDSREGDRSIKAIEMLQACLKNLHVHSLSGRKLLQNGHQCLKHHTF